MNTTQTFSFSFSKLRYNPFGSTPEKFANIWQIKWNWIRSKKFETVRIYFLNEFSVYLYPKILLPWQRDVTTSLLYGLTIHKLSTICLNSAFPSSILTPRTSLNQSSIPISWSWLLLLLLLLLIDSEEGYLGEDFKTFLVTGKFIWHCQQSFLKRTLEPGYEWFTVLKKSMAMDINLLPVIFSQIEMVSDVQM